jgi:hypothetical protein
LRNVSQLKPSVSGQNQVARKDLGKHGYGTAGNHHQSDRKFLPDKLSRFLLTEDGPHEIAARVAIVVASSFRPPLDEVRRLLVLEYGSNRMVEELENVLTTAAKSCTANSRPTEAVAS